MAMTASSTELATLRERCLQHGFKCFKVRDDKGYWNQPETYVHTHTDAKVSQGLCPKCLEDLYGGQAWYEKGKF